MSELFCLASTISSVVHGCLRHWETECVFNGARSSRSLQRTVLYHPHERGGGGGGGGKRGLVKSSKERISFEKSF